MLIKLWERIRGYDRWVQTDATIKSSSMEDHVYDYRGQIKHEYESVDTLVWTDREGNQQTAPYRVPDDSPLYQLVGGEKVTIRYNPRNPEECYFPELFKGRLRHFLLQLAIVVLFLGAILVGVFLFGRAYK
jgi:hypothetical protein